MFSCEFCEISKNAFITERLRATASAATRSSTCYRRLSLMQGGLQIPCVVNVKLIGTKKNEEILGKYLETVQNYYTEPSSDEDVIIGFFLVMLHIMLYKNIMKMQTL